MRSAATGVRIDDRSPAFISGIYEHPERRIPHTSLAQLHAEVAVGALRDAGLALSDVDAYFCDSDAPGFGGFSVAEYLGLNLTHLDTTDTGGSAYLFHINHAAQAIADGRVHVALISQAGTPRRNAAANLLLEVGTAPESSFEDVYGITYPALYALAARRHMYEFGTTSEQLAEVKVAASQHAQHNPHALLRVPVSVEEVLDSPLIADPLHRLDCCVVTDGGGAIVLTSAEVARTLSGPRVRVLGYAEAVQHGGNGRVDLTSTAGAVSGPRAFEAAGLTPGDIRYASIYDSYTITVIQTIEDLGFCGPGGGGAFVADGALRAPFGRLPVNTDGGGLCNNHPGNRGGMPKIIEAVRQLRGQAAAAVQVPDLDTALVHGTGGALATRMGSATLLLGRED